MRGLLVTAAVVGMFVGAPAVAQDGAGPLGAATTAAEQAEVDEYVCIFNNNCPPDADAPLPTKKAPPLRTFRIVKMTGAGGTASPRVAYVPSHRIHAAGGARSPRLAGRPGRGYGNAHRETANANRAMLAANAGAAAVGTGGAGPVLRANLLLPFGYNSAQLSPDVAARARTFARALMTPSLSAKRFLIEGHTDSRGRRSFNLDLSQRRAQAVADYLVSLGVDRSRVEVRGVGPDEPLPGRSARAEANRRVEAVLLS